MVGVALVECNCLGEELMIFVALVSTWDGFSCLVDVTSVVCGEGSESSWFCKWNRCALFGWFLM